nr:hypothetical protein [Tanacetum cinerariifolium]
INIDALYNILKKNQGDVNDAMGSKKKTVVVTSDPLALIAEKTNVSRSKEKVLYLWTLKESANKKQEYVKTDTKRVEKKDDEKKRDMSRVKCYNCKKEGHFGKDCKKAKVKDSEYYKIKMLLAKKDKDEQVLLAEDQAWMESSSDSDQEINANMVFIDQIEKVLYDSEASLSSADEKISEVSFYLSESESESEFETSEYYDNSTNYGLFVNNDDDQEIFYDVIDSASVESSEKVISEIENKSKNDCQVIEKVCDSEENLNVIAPGMFKLSMSQSVTLISVTKTSCASNSVETKLKRKRHKRTSSKQNDKQVNNAVLRANRDFVHFSDLDNLNSVKRPKDSGVMWMRKGSSNTVKDDLSSVNHSKLNKNVKRYSRKNLMACNNSDTRNAFDCNNARNALSNARMNASVNVNDLFVFDDIAYGLSMESGFLGSGGKGGGRKNDKHKEASGSNEAAIVGKNMVVYVNVGGHAVVNAANTSSGNESANVATTSTQNVKQVSSIVQVSANDVIKRDVLTKNTKGAVSFVKLVTDEPSRKNVNFCTLLAPAGNEADVAISLESVRVVSEHFANSVYGFFLGKHVLAENEMDAMLENGHWFIRNIPLILKKWISDVNLLKEDVCNILVWVKFHNVPITTFSMDGLSVIATNLGTPLMLDSYNSVMCTKSWGRSSYARAMFELRADVELKDTIVVAVLKLVENCLGCLKNIVSKCLRGLQVGPKLGFNLTKQVYQPVSKMNGASSSGKKKQVRLTRQEVSNSNLFDALNTVENDNDLVNADSDSEVDVVFNETAGLMASTSSKVDNNSKSGSGVKK